MSSHTHIRTQSKAYGSHAKLLMAQLSSKPALGCKPLGSLQEDCPGLAQREREIMEPEVSQWPPYQVRQGICFLKQTPDAHWCYSWVGFNPMPPITQQLIEALWVKFLLKKQHKSGIATNRFQNLSIPGWYPGNAQWYAHTEQYILHTPHHTTLQHYTTPHYTTPHHTTLTTRLVAIVLSLHFGFVKTDHVKSCHLQITWSNHDNT